VAQSGLVDIDAKFLQAVSPNLAVISVAAKNDYHYPHPSTLAALNKADAIVYTTAINGTIVMTLMKIRSA
jgi:competence protein ComEC